MAQTETAASNQPSAKKEGTSYYLRVKVAEKWKTVGTLFQRADGTGGVATLFKEVVELLKDGREKLENVAVFVNDGKYAGAKKA